MISQEIKSSDFIISLLKKMGTFTFVSNLGNLGDGFITTTTYMLFDKNNLNYKIVSHPDSHEDQVVFADSGRYCGIYDYSYLTDFLKKTTASKIVFLPNTFHNCDNLIKLFDKRFIIFCRDKRSYEYVLSFKTEATVYCAHDLAFSWQEKDLKLIKKEHEESIPLGKRYSLWNYALPVYKNIQFLKIGTQTYNVSYLLREDIERQKQLRTLSYSFDLSKIYLGNFVNKSITYWTFKLFRAAIQCSDVIITDRLHVGIMAATLGKEVILLDNSYSKVLNIWKMSMQHMNNVCLLDHYSNLEQEVYQILQNVPLAHTANTKDFLKLNPVPEAELYN